MRTALLGRSGVLVSVLALSLTAGTGRAAAQGGITASLSGVVADTSGGVLPGADVLVRNNATGAEYTAVTAANGTFTIPALLPGTYTARVSLQGFKQVVLNDIVINAGTPASVRATLSLGELAETVVVSGASDIVQTQSSAVATTLDVKQISNLPLTSRSVLDFVVNLPGVNTPGGSRNSTVNGLPQSAINITLDGINIQDNTLKTTDGFFAIVNPRMDAIDEVTVSSAAQGAEAAGQGAVQIRFVTRSGTNQFSGSGYWYHRNDSLNENTWFNKRDRVAKPELLQNQPGFRLGGPVMVPGLFDGHNRAFFFVNYEEFRQPQTITRNRTILSPEAQAGIFRYQTSNGIQSVNLFDLARRNNEIATPDPTVTQVLNDIRAATGTTGAVTPLSDPNLLNFRYNVDQRSLNRYPTVRVDVNVSDRHRIASSINYQRFLSVPDTLNGREPFFPGFPVTGTQQSQRIGISNSLRSTLGGNAVNELRIGGSGAPVKFFPELKASLWSGTNVADQGGFLLNMNNAVGITNAGGAATPSSRNAYTWLIEDTLNLIKGKHSFSVGGSWNEVDVWLRNQTLVPEVRFDIVTGDPADAMFTSANFPGSSTTHRNEAGDLYAVLTGRVSSILGNAGLDENTGQYSYLGARMQRGQLREYAFWAQDGWRARSDLTLNLGLRYELQTPFHPRNDSYSNATLEDVWGRSGLSAGCTNASRVTPENCNLFKPGVLEGRDPVFVPFTKGQNAYNMDLNNFSPSVGFAWTPSAEGGFLRGFLGSPGDTVFRGGFLRSFNRPGMSDFTGRFDDNPGILLTVNREQDRGNLGTLPVLLRNRNTLGPPSFPSTRVYPMTDDVTEDVATFDPNIQVPYADTWTAGWQREISHNMAVEARYVGTRSRDLWTTYNYNEINIVENGFLGEFVRAQQNLQSNIAAGRGANFRYYGPGTGTSPLPIFLAYFAGAGAGAANDPSKYGSALFASSTFVNPLAKFNPSPFGAANALDADPARRNNALAAGLPANFLVANPDRLGGAEVDGNGGYSNYHSGQFELRRRLSNGLQFQTSYVFGRAIEAAFYSFRRPFLTRLDSGTEGGVTHAWKANWVYELPFGRGRRFGGNAGGALDRLIGGWQVHGTARVQSGRLVDLGNVRMVGFDKGDLKKMFKVRKDADNRVWMLPQDVIDNTVKAFSVSATSLSGYSALGAPAGRYFAPANGPDCIEIAMQNIGNETSGFGDCGTGSLVVRGPVFKNVDLSVAKLVPLAGRVRAEFRFELLNAFNFVNFAPVRSGISGNWIGADPNEYELNGLDGETASRVVQIVSRVSW
jgi:carboxypeptidase family protein/TonB-dependent receptor-like protein